MVALKNKRHVEKCDEKTMKDRMRADWRTEAAVDRRQTGHWRLGLTIVLQRPRHG